MRFPVFTLRGSALSLALAAAFPLHAQAVTLAGVVVTATRSPTPAAALVSEVTVIDRHAIEDSTARTLPELLARTAGVQISSNGARVPFGNFNADRDPFEQDSANASARYEIAQTGASMPACCMPRG